MEFRIGSGNPFEILFGGPKTPFKVGIVGGTFGPLHDGHKFMLKAALVICEFIQIGLESDEMAKKKDKNIADFNTRFHELFRFMEEFAPRRYAIVPITDFKGMVTDNHNVDVLICSDELEVIERAIKFNEERRAMRIHELLLFVVPRIRGPDGRVISSTRIRKGEIPQSVTEVILDNDQD